MYLTARIRAFSLKISSLIYEKKVDRYWVALIIRKSSVLKSAFL